MPQLAFFWRESSARFSLACLPHHQRLRAKLRVPGLPLLDKGGGAGGLPFWPSCVGTWGWSLIRCAQERPSLLRRGVRLPLGRGAEGSWGGGQGPRGASIVLPEAHQPRLTVARSPETRWRRKAAPPQRAVERECAARMLAAAGAAVFGGAPGLAARDDAGPGEAGGAPPIRAGGGGGRTSAASCSRSARVSQPPAIAPSMREIVHIQAGQCGNQIGAKVRLRGPVCRSPHWARVPRPQRASRVPSASGSRGREAPGRRCVRTEAPQARLTTAKPRRPRRNGWDRVPPTQCRRAAGTPGSPCASPTPAFPLPRPGYLGPAGGTAQVSGSLLSSPPRRCRCKWTALAGRGPLLWGRNSASGEMGGVDKLGWGSPKSHNDSLCPPTPGA